MLHTTLIILKKDDEILLGLKKRGFGKGRLNGVGGKLEPGETIEEAAIRETEEEIGVNLTKMEMWRISSLTTFIIRACQNAT